MKLIAYFDRAFMGGLMWATSSKSAAYLLSLLILLSVIVNPPSNVQGWLLVIVSVFYQGVALPGIGSAQKAEGEATRALLQETHDATMQTLAGVQEELEMAREERREMAALVKFLHERFDERK